MNAVEIDSWRLEQWSDVGGVVMAYKRTEYGEWQSSNYYRSDELRRAAPGSPRHAADGGDGRD